MFHNFMNKIYFNQNNCDLNKISFKGHFYDNSYLLKKNSLLDTDNNYINYFQNLDFNKILEANSPKKNIKNTNIYNYDYSKLNDLIIKKYKLCESIKKKNFVDVGIQCNIDNYEDFEIIDDCGIPNSSFIAVGKYLNTK